MMKINAYDAPVSSFPYTPPSRKHTCNPYVTPNMMIEITGSELLPVATTTIRYPSYKTPSAHSSPSHISSTHIDDSSRKNLQPRQQRSIQQAKKTYDRSQQIDKHKESHREATKSTQLGQDHQLQQVVHCRVDPSTSLREQDPP